MYIKQIELNGFKSYAHHTVIKGWDKNFNAITGLNGSGKSNILDAICFVLGITNLKRVRVSKLQELVYKQGQSGITKASVSIIFDNTDKHHSPFGYENMSEIVITRIIAIGSRNKYLINGHGAQSNHVQTLFQSIQMNVNNPHFLIMQGRVTQVLNMSPPEILGLLEEAAGTRLYENKKKAAVATIAKKQAKLIEIDEILTGKIAPERERLDKERKHYHSWTQNKMMIERNSRFVVAYKYVYFHNLIEKGGETREENKEKVENYTNELKQLESSIEEMSTQIERDSEKIHNDQVEGEEKFVESRKVATIDFTKVKTQHKNLQKDLSREERVLKNMEKNETSQQQKLVHATNEGKEKEEHYEELKKEFDHLEETQKRLESQQLGFSMNDDNNKGTLAQQLMEAQRESSEHQSGLRTCENKRKNLNSQVKRTRGQMQRAQSDYQRQQKRFDLKNGELQRLQEDLKGHDFNEEEYTNLEQEVRERDGRHSECAQQVHDMKGNLAHFEVQYRRKPQGVNLNNVYGAAGRLFRVKDLKFATALSKTAGGGIYSVVADSTETVKNILKQKVLMRRVNFLPLSNMNPRTLKDRQIRAAKDQYGEDNIHFALDLIEYEPHLRKAMEHIFGKTLITSCSPKDAKRMCYDPNIACTVVTLGGNRYDTSGVVSGGSSANKSNVLVDLHHLSEIEDQERQLRHDLDQVRHKLNKLQETYHNTRKIRQRVDSLQHEVSLLQTQLNETPFAKLQETIQKYESELKGIDEQSKEFGEKHKESSERCKSLKNSIENFEKERERQTERLANDIKDTKKKLKAMQKNLLKAQEIAEKLVLEKQQIEEDITGLSQQKEEKQKEIETLGSKLEEMGKNLEEKRVLVEQLTKQHEAFSERLNKMKESLREKKEELKKLENSNLTLKEEIGHLQRDIERSLRQQDQATESIEELKTENQWIDQEKNSFGKKGTDFDFKSRDYKDVEKRLKKLKEEQELLNNRVDHKAMSRYEKTQKQYDELIMKRKTVSNDKRKIQTVIKDLDSKKRSLLEKTFEKVNRDLGDIFKTLLPGTNARLRPPEGQSIIDGLELRVAFSGVWKESLSELSGGQRSLLSLSLILAFLRYKPAPMYILDEVDAALDLSHTQNIGKMLRNYFAKSQFIVVSLKEGMFTNANVIFKTKFVDGVSTVSRTVPLRKRNK